MVGLTLGGIGGLALGLNGKAEIGTAISVVIGMLKIERICLTAAIALVLRVADVVIVTAIEGSYLVTVRLYGGLLGIKM